MSVIMTRQEKRRETIKTCIAGVLLEVLFALVLLLWFKGVI